MEGVDQWYLNVFISWSGAQSRQVALALRRWLPQVLQRVRPWMSATDIDAGARWSNHVSSQLETTRFGIICLTRENLRAPWVLFEAGALAKTLEGTFVCPYLLDLGPSDVANPLGQFQAVRADEDGTRSLVYSINAAMACDPLGEVELGEAFELWWPRLRDQLQLIPREVSPDQPVRRDDEILRDLLEAVRAQGRALENMRPFAGPSAPITGQRYERRLVSSDRRQAHIFRTEAGGWVAELGALQRTGLASLEDARIAALDLAGRTPVELIVHQPGRVHHQVISGIDVTEPPAMDMSDVGEAP